MSKTIDYYLTLRSPWAYLGSRRLEEIAARHGAEIAVKPVDYGTIFPRTGGLPLPKRAPERQAYRLVELRRWRAHLDMPLNLHPAHFAVDENLAARVVMAAAPMLQRSRWRLASARRSSSRSRTSTTAPR